MKITLGQLKDAEVALDKVLKAELDFPVAYSLRKFVRAIRQQKAHYDEEQNLIVQKYGQKGVDGKLIYKEIGDGKITFDVTDLAAYQAELKQLNEVSVDLDLSLIHI